MARMARPVAALPLAMNRNRRRLAFRPAGWASGWAMAPCPGMTCSMLEGVTVISTCLSGARVEQRVRHVRQQVGDQHRDGDDQEDALHQRVVVRADGLEELEAHPRVGEYDLDQQRAADDEAQRQRE